MMNSETFTADEIRLLLAGLFLITQDKRLIVKRDDIMQLRSKLQHMQASKLEKQ